MNKNCPKSGRDRCLIEGFGGVFVLALCIFDFFYVVRTFVTGLSEISSYFS